MGFVAGFYYLAVPVGVTLSFYIAGFLGPLWGWRNCFYALGLLGLVLALLVLLFKETPEREESEALVCGIESSPNQQNPNSIPFGLDESPSIED